ncbi:MAG: hypothetical protein KJ587_19775 [Alphaproteobacteria bacterium]|nr:hypothetical protein [Alphaproteobacteria bacterium]
MFEVQQMPTFLRKWWLKKSLERIKEENKKPNTTQSQQSQPFNKRIKK